MTKIIIANWKMQLGYKEAIMRLKTLNTLAKTKGLIICPDFTILYQARAILAGSKIQLGAQNVGIDTKGAYTGEVSPLVLKSLGCKYVIVGHSERRRLLGEDNQLIAKKLQTCHGLTPILCVGENIKQELKVVKTKKIIIAFEPLAAIGTGNAMDAKKVKAIISMIRKTLGFKCPVLYGGSVDAKNAKEFVTISGVDGFLVGKASLNPKTLMAIVNSIN